MRTRSDEKYVEALTVAMVVAPGVYARNRMFDFFSQEHVRRAKSRAAMLRGVVPQLAHAMNTVITRDGTPRDPSGEPTYVLRYQIPSIHLARVVEMSPTELAVLRVLLHRANVHALHPDSNDRALVEAALTRLMDQSPLARDLLRAGF